MKINDFQILLELVNYIFTYVFGATIAFLIQWSRPIYYISMCVYFCVYVYWGKCIYFPQSTPMLQCSPNLLIQLMYPIDLPLGLQCLIQVRIFCSILIKGGYNGHFQGRKKKAKNSGKKLKERKKFEEKKRKIRQIKFRKTK